MVSDHLIVCMPIYKNINYCSSLVLSYLKQVTFRARTNLVTYSKIKRDIRACLCTRNRNENKKSNFDCGSFLCLLRYWRIRLCGTPRIPFFGGIEFSVGGGNAWPKQKQLEEIKVSLGCIHNNSDKCLIVGRVYNEIGLCEGKKRF